MRGSTNLLALSTTSVVRAIVIGAVATLIAVATSTFAGPRLTALEWSTYDHWLRARAMPPARQLLVVVTRDAASEARLGGGAWDRAVLARVISGLARAGAGAIGVDVRPGSLGSPARGGPSSDALLSQATKLAETVVYPIAVEPVSTAASGDGRKTAGPNVEGHPSWPMRSRIALALGDAIPAGDAGPGRDARAIGHTFGPADPDGVVRRVPLFVGSGEKAVPAFALALAATRMNAAPEGVAVERGSIVVRAQPATGVTPEIRVPVDARGNALVDYRIRNAAARVVPFQEIWTAIEAGQIDAVQQLVDDRIVLILGEPSRELRQTPIGAISDVDLEVHTLNTLVNGPGLREIPTRGVAPVALVVAIVIAWLGLTRRWWMGPGVAVVLVTGYATTRALALDRGLVFPLIVPAMAVLIAPAGAFLWRQLVSAHRVRDLEHEILRVQSELRTASDALVRQESTVEALEEDLEAARQAVLRSTGAERELVRATDALREQLAGARVQEEETRDRLQKLEGELRGLRAVEVRRTAPLPDAERERLRDACEQMGIVTGDPAVLTMFRDLERAAPSSLPILITGEPGTGKELFARAAHRLSSRAAGPFVAVNVAAIPTTLFESELFGHVRGSFTGAVSDRRGLFEQAQHGTLFLDEVGDLQPDLQAKLLRVLQEKTFYRVGATRPTEVDVRVIAATNRDLEQGIVDGSFREDLYFRLKGLVLRLPPLRDRIDDVALLAPRLVAESAAELGRPEAKLSDDALRALKRQPWAGNVRELQNCLRQAVALGDGPVLTEADLRLSGQVKSGGGRALADPDGDAAVLECLRSNRFDMRATAEALGWDRSTVTQRLKGLGFRALVDSAGDRARAAVELAGDPALARTVELKLREYHDHLLRSVEGFDSADQAVAACRRRFKNLPERHFRSLELLVRGSFESGAPSSGRTRR